MCTAIERIERLGQLLEVKSVTVRLERPSSQVGHSAWHRERWQHHAGDRAFPWFLMLPAVLLVVLVTFLPVVQAVRLSVHDTSYPVSYTHLTLPTIYSV